MPKPVRITVPDILARKGKDKLACLTAYTTPMAQLLDEQCDILLVGDSVGMVLHGLPTPVGVTLDMMIMHGRAVMRGSSRALVAVDLPFGSYERNADQALKSAALVLRKTGCQAVKIEICDGAAETISFMTARGVPVIAHIGLRPQAANIDGGFKAKGKSDGDRRRILADAKAVDDAGSFAIVIEGVASDLADEITTAVRAPTIGIGASASCDGQILVVDDMLGMFERTPRFVRRYGDMRSIIERARDCYVRDVRSGDFPGPSEIYGKTKK
jgi:3-methyl-2-oxobutanoate hydroxymethyltransferase